ncbi:MAG: hypothetical protein M1833_006859 [Piccolia ochrophora]|nr:MAG: hypothetical protein M1833_006859 [Piccolia ochrophora]
MQSSQTPSSAESPGGVSNSHSHSQSHATKRKLSSLHPLAQPTSSPPRPTENEPPSPQLRQSTLSELFAQSQNKLSAPERDDACASSTTKRRKSNFVPLSTYSIPTAKAMLTSLAPKNQPGVVDLTGSSRPSPSANTTMANGFGRNTNFQPFAGARRLPIKNLRKTPRSDPQAYFQHIWGQVDAALTAIFAREPLPYSLEELYRGVENVCQQNGASDFFERVKARCSHHVKSTVKAALAEKAGSGRSNPDVLRMVHAAWAEWDRQLLTVLRILYFLDRSYLLNSTKQPGIKELGIDLFRRHIFLDTTFKKRILQGMCDLVGFERAGHLEANDLAVLRQSIRMVYDLAIYSTEFEPKLLRSSEVYYTDWADEESTCLSLAGYVRASRESMDKESTRWEMLGLDANTRRELVALLDESLIRQRANILTNVKAVSELLETNDSTTLELLYSLLFRVKLHTSLSKPWTEYIKTAGAQIVSDEQRASEMVTRLLEFKQRLDVIWKTSFSKFDNLAHDLRESFAAFINERRQGNSWNANNTKAGELIAKYIDLLLRGGVKAIPASLGSIGGQSTGAIANEDDAAAIDEDAELSKQLDQVLDLFRFIEGKDVFEAFYKKDLARRLLMARSASADAERTMLARLKNECGASFTHNLEQMFRDIDLARDDMASYKMTREERGKKDAMDINVNVLSASAWPSYPDVPVTVPEDIMAAVNDYDRHYKSKHSGRVLTWKHALAHCTMKAQFPRGNKELVVSSFQAIVLMLFNGVPESERLTYCDIQNATGLSDIELQRTLQSLACAKFRVLTKHPKGKDVDPADSFSVHLAFHEAKYRIKINQIQLKETKEENKATHEDVTRDRQYETQAAIVRVMKSRKTISAGELMAETISLTKRRGALEPAEIKKQIDKLIEKDYIEREMLDGGGIAYNYLA